MMETQLRKGRLGEEVGYGGRVAVQALKLGK